MLNLGTLTSGAMTWRYSGPCRRPSTSPMRHSLTLTSPGGALGEEVLNKSNSRMGVSHIVTSSEDEGKWSGITGYVESGFTDIVFGGFALSALANMVTQPKWFLEKDFLASAPMATFVKFFSQQSSQSFRHLPVPHPSQRTRSSRSPCLLDSTPGSAYCAPLSLLG